eukprot:8459902-Heterocapsa_arctica.AAC.1
MGGPWWGGPASSAAPSPQLGRGSSPQPAESAAAAVPGRWAWSWPSAVSRDAEPASVGAPAPCSAEGGSRGSRPASEP